MRHSVGLPGPRVSLRRRGPRPISWTLAAAMVTACAPPSPSTPARERDDGPDRPTTQAARRPTASSLLEAPAVVVGGASARAEVGPTHAARLEALLVRPGDTVAEFDPVARVRSPVLGRAAADYAAARSELRLLRERLEALAPLRREGLARSETLFELESRQAQRRGDLARAKVELEASGAPSATWAELGRGAALVLRAPISGTVTEVHGAIGEMIDPSGSPLAVIVRDEPARVEVRVALAPEQVARFELVLPDGELAPLGEEPVGRAVDPATGGLRMWLETDPARALPDGLRLTVRARPADDVLEVPATAVDRRDGSPRVWVMDPDGGAVRPVAIAVIRATDSRALVQGELTPGDQVLVDPSARPAPGAPP